MSLSEKLNISNSYRPIIKKQNVDSLPSSIHFSYISDQTSAIKKDLPVHYPVEILLYKAHLKELTIEELLINIKNIKNNKNIELKLNTEECREKEQIIIEELKERRTLNSTFISNNQFKNIENFFEIDLDHVSELEEDCNNIIFSSIYPKADINPTNINGETPLMLAAAYGLSIIVISLLARQSIEINKTDKFGRTALHRAVENRHNNIVEKLLQHQDIELDIRCMNLVNLAEEEDTPLDLAVLSNSTTLVKMFLTHRKFDKKTINNVNSHGQTLLWRACENNKCEVVKLLIACEGVQINKVSYDGFSPYSRAALHEYTDIMQLFLFLKNPDTEINTRVGSKETPILTWAMNGERWNIMELLIQHPKFHTLELEQTDQISFFNSIFKKIATPEKGKNRTIAKRIFDRAVENEKKSQKLICAFFRSKDFKVSQSYYIKGVHPLVWAFKNNQIEDVLFLLKRFNEGIEDCIVNEINLLQWAFDNMNMGIIKSLLCRKNVNTNDITDSHTFLMRWTQKVCKHEIEGKKIEKYLKFFRFLMSHLDANVLAQVSEGGHILNWSMKCNANEVTKFLLAWENIELDFQDTEGKTPLYWAFFHGNKKIINLLLTLLNANDKKIKKVRDAAGNSILHWAVALGDAEIINSLLSNKNIELRAQNCDKFTPYSLAKKYAETAYINEVKTQFLKIAALIDVKVKAQIAEENLKHAKSTDQDVKEKLGEAALKHFQPTQSIDKQVRSSGSSGGVSISMDVLYNSTLSQSADASMNYLRHSSYISGLSNRNPRNMSNFYEVPEKVFRDTFNKK